MMQRLLYNLILVFALPLIALRLVWRSIRQPAYLKHVGERFGWYATPVVRPLIWIHAVSVGEARAAQSLIAALRKQYGGASLLVTYMTPTGRATGEELFGESVAHAYLPYDYGATVARFLDHFKPTLGLIMETELWPNLITACARRGVPVGLVNARMSERSAKGYQKLPALTRETLRSLAFISAQSADDATRLARLGATDITVCGNIKFDMLVDAAQAELGKRWRETTGRPVVLAASTREGEEKIILDAWQALSKERRANILLVIVPRHPQRFDAVAELAAARGFKLARRSATLPDATLDVWLGDSMGEMAAYYALCDVAIMGGSLLDFGSQNLIEACAQGKPVVLGPSIFNFSEVARLALQEGAARQAQDAVRVAEMACDLILAPAELHAAAAAALRFTAAHRGATQKNMALIAPCLSRPKTSA